MSELSLSQVKSLVRDIPDFPKQGIVFKDITPALAHPGALAFLCKEMAASFASARVDKVLALESRGFFFGTGVAERLNAGLVPIRKKGKLPWQTFEESYSLEYGEATLEVHQDAVKKGERVLIVDDVLATGGTIRAARKLVERLGGELVGATCFIEISFLKGREALSPMRIESVWVL